MTRNRVAEFRILRCTELSVFMNLGIQWNHNMMIFRFRVLLHLLSGTFSTFMELRVSEGA